jgi:prevent-host-death family protein
MAANSNISPKSITALTARTQFGQIMRRASGKKQERFLVEKRGEPTVVILGVEDFLKTIAPEPEVLAAIRAESKKNKTDKLSMREIDREISAYRKERKLNYVASKRRP